ncbi:Xaa-Pro peptidase family protein [Mesorhizobium sp. M0933]|uniref:M24 family metallopeptidase n=1 Tax=Mesorhizobium sp. M0933 TaxID=2957030 RepID=UPI003334D5C8
MSRTLAFTISEYQERLRSVKQRMEAAGVSTLFVISEPNIVYLTGYEGFSAYVPQGLLVCLSDEQPTLILREMDVLCANSVYLNDEHIIQYDEDLLGLGEEPVWRRIGEIIAARRKRGRLAIERSARGLTVDNYAALTKAIGPVEIVEGSGWVNAVRAVKSTDELMYMRRAGAIADAAILAGVKKIGRDVREADVSAEVVSTLAAGTTDFPGGPPITGPVMAVGPISNAPHVYWSSGIYQAGMQTNFETGAYQRRYSTAVSRTAFLGKPSARLVHIDQSVRDAFEATLPAFKTGARCCDVYARFWEVFGPAGVKKKSRIGYGIGIDWAEGNYSLQRDDTSILLANSTLHFIVGIWEREEGYILSETVRVTDGGAESFSTIRRGMFVIE